MKINMHEAKTRLSQLGEMVWRGERVVIAKSGKPYLDLLPHKEAAERVPGRFKGQIKISEDFNEEVGQLNQWFEGE